MNIKYNLHDSLIEQVVYDVKNGTVDIKMDLCNWLQNGYVEGDPENKIIHMLFSEVSYMKKEYYEYDLDSSEILDVSEIDNNTIKIVFNGDSDVGIITISSNNIHFIDE